MTLKLPHPQRMIRLLELDCLYFSNLSGKVDKFMVMTALSLQLDDKMQKFFLEAETIKLKCFLSFL